MRHLELGVVLDDGRYICDGCNVREPFEHRCHGSDGEWLDGRVCVCDECREPWHEFCDVCKVHYSQHDQDHLFTAASEPSA